MNSPVHIEELTLNGYRVLRSYLDAELLEKVIDIYDDIYQTQKSMCEADGSLSSQDLHNIRCPVAFSVLFLELACLKAPIEVIKYFLGNHIVLLANNAVTNLPNQIQYQARWHRDLPYQHFTSSHPLAMNFLITLDEFTSNNGATMVIPGSHMHQHFPSDAYVTKHQKSLLVPRGSVIIMNAMTYHRSGDNTSSSSTRRAVNHVVGAPILSQQINIPSYIAEISGLDYSSDPFLYEYLGYKWNAARNVSTFTKQRQ